MIVVTSGVRRLSFRLGVTTRDSSVGFRNHCNLAYVVPLFLCSYFVHPPRSRYDPVLIVRGSSSLPSRMDLSLHNSIM